MGTRAAAAALLVMILTASARIAAAQTPVPQAPVARFVSAFDVIKGRTATRVVVEGIPALRQVLDPATLRTDIERKLRQNGVTVPDDAAEPTTIYRVLYLWVNAGASSDGSLVYNVSLEYRTLLEATLLGSSDTGLMLASVWEQGTLGVASRQNVAQTIRHVVDDQLAAFLNVYLDANPQK